VIKVKQGSRLTIHFGSDMDDEGGTRDCYNETSEMRSNLWLQQKKKTKKKQEEFVE
jgi:hypothetical protein